MMRAFEHAGIDWTDGMTPMMEARAIKSPDEQKGSGSWPRSATRSHYEMSRFLKPGLTENQVAAFGFEYLYAFPGVEDVEDVIVSSGPNAWPNWRNFSDRIIRPGELVIIDVAALTWNGFKSCVYRTYCVGGKPTDEMRQYYDHRARLAAGLDRRGEARRDDARTSPSKWPSAMETWGYEDEDEAAANLWGHGLGLAQYDQPVISRIWSLDHPIEIKPGMVFALETQHGKVHDFGVRLEEMLICLTGKFEMISTSIIVHDQHLLDAHAPAEHLAVLGFEREHHPRLDLDRMVERPDARDHRRVVLGETEAVAPQVGGRLVLFLVAVGFLGRWPLRRDLARRRAGFHRADRVVQPLERRGVDSFCSSRRLLADAVRAVVARLVAVPRQRGEVHEHDVAGLNDAVGEVAPVRPRVRPRRDDHVLDVLHARECCRGTA